MKDYVFYLFLKIDLESVELVLTPMMHDNQGVVF